MNQHTDLSRPKTPTHYLRLYFTGFAMGSADIVPGVSGGTMAFILGVYETLLNAIKSVDLSAVRMGLKFDIKGLLEHIPIRFLIALGLGILSAIFALSSILHNLLTNQPTFIFAFFGGLIVASILAIGYKVRWDVWAIAALTVTAVFAFILVGIEAEEPVSGLVAAVERGDNTAERETELIADLEAAGVQDAAQRVAMLVADARNKLNTEAEQEALNDALEKNYKASDPVTLFFSGMVAICAMILPGISGSFMLLIMGQYQAVLGAVKHFDFISLAAVAAGCAIGIMAFSRILSWLLKHYENVTVAALTGFMLGSLRLIYTQAADGVRKVSDSGALDSSQIVLVIVLITFGFALVSLMDHLQSGKNLMLSLFWRPQRIMDNVTDQASALD